MSATSDELQFEPEQAPVRPRSSGCLKWFLILAGVGGIMMLVCCGVGYYFGAPTIVNKPAQIDAISHEIADTKMLPDFVGKMGVKWNFFGFMQMRMCLYSHATGKGELQLVEISMNGADAGGNAEIEAQIQKQKKVEMKALTVKSTESREIEIRGQSAKFTTVFGQDVSSNTEYYQVEGTFLGKNGPAKLMLQVEAEIWDAEAVTELLESLK